MQAGGGQKRMYAAMVVTFAILLGVYALVIGLNRHPAGGVSVERVLPNDADAVVASLFGAGGAAREVMAPNVARGAAMPGGAATA
jgi:hypothetical protein